MKNYFAAISITSMMLLSLAASPLPEKANPKATASNSSIFEPPVRLSVGDKPLNTVAKKRFPSPSMFDVDGDGNVELVIGTLMGAVGVYKNQNTSGKGDPVWGPWESLKGIDGKAIKTPNW